MPSGSSQDADPAIGGIEGRERDAGDGGRQGEGKIHQRVDDAPPGEFVAHEHPGYDPAEDRIHNGRDQCGAEAELQRRDHARRRNDVPESLPAQANRPEQQARERDQDDQREICERITEGQAVSRHDARLAPQRQIGEKGQDLMHPCVTQRLLSVMPAKAGIQGR